MSTSGGKKLKELAKKYASNLVARVGLLEGAKYSDGTPVAYIGAIQEFGYKENKDDEEWAIPPRPFLRTAFDKKRKEWVDNLANALEATHDMKKSLETVADLAKGDIKESLNEGPWVENAKSTIKRKGSKQPLVASGNMRDSINFEVVEQDE